VTNVVLNAIVLVVVLVLAVPALRHARKAPVVWTVVHLCVLTLVFDSVMISARLYEFDPDKILGLYLWRAPLEDFFYAVVAGLAIPALWVVLGRRRPVGPFVAPSPLRASDEHAPQDDGPSRPSDQRPDRPGAGPS